MPVTILYFARVRELVGVSSEELDLPADIATVSDLVDWLSHLKPHYAAAFADRSRLRAALDQNMARFEDLIAGAKEIAFFPPVTGG